MAKRAKEPLDPMSEAAAEKVRADEMMAANAARMQEERDAMALEVGLVLGRVQMAAAVSKFADVGGLVQLARIKESKAYKHVPALGTWEKFCESAGLNRQHTDERLGILRELGEEFARTSALLGLGHRDLRKLRQLSRDGAVEVSGTALKIGAEEIPLDEEHVEELQEAIEGALKRRDELIDSMEHAGQARERVLKGKEDQIHKLAAQVDKLEGAARKRKQTPDETALDAALSRARAMCDGLMLELDASGPDSILGDNPTEPMIRKYLAAMRAMKTEIDALYSTSVEALAPGAAIDVYEDGADGVKRFGSTPVGRG